MSDPIDKLSQELKEFRADVSEQMNEMIQIAATQAHHEEQYKKLFEIYGKQSARLRDLELKFAAKAGVVSNNERMLWLFISGAVGVVFWLLKG